MKPVDGAADGRWVGKIARRVEGWALALALAAGGAIVGFAYSEYRLHQVVVDLREAQREEITRLRKQVRQLTIEREILSKAAAWFARETDSIPPKSSNS